MVIVSTTAAAPTGVLAGVSDAGPEATLTLIMRDIKADKLDAALVRTEGLIKLYPNFRLAHLIHGDLLLARSRSIASFGNAPGAPADRVADLRDEASARLRGYTQKPSPTQVPRYLLQMRPDQKFALVADTQRSRLYVYRNEQGRPVFVADYYITQGKAGAEKFREGDRKTPVGVYHVTSFLPREKLTDFYGAGAFPINYPNTWDRLKGRDGHGIWLHGVPSDTYSRPPKASDGCVVLSNEDLSRLSHFVQTGVTPVIISQQVEWLSIDGWQAERAALNKAIDTWRGDWESLDVDRYLRHYADRFRSPDGNLSSWSMQKRNVAKAKTWVKVELRNMSVFRTPGKEEVVEVTFEQRYRSNNLSNVARKRQYWVKEGGQWKIIYEGVAA